MLFFIIYLFIYVLKNLYISSLIFWAVLHHSVQEQLPVCKQFYIRKKEGVKTTTCSN